MKKTFKRMLIFIISLLLLFCFSFNIETSAKEANSVNVYLFYKVGCPHCEKAEEFLNSYIEEHNNINLSRYEKVKNQELFDKFKNAFDITEEGTPFIFIGGKYFRGYNQTIELQLEYLLNKYSNKDFVDVGFLLVTNQKLPTNYIDTEEMKYNLPILGDITPKDVSLFGVSIILGFLDGINPCGMWVLLFIISMLIPLNDKKKIWILGGAFILTSGIFYFIMMMSWMTALKSLADESIFLIIMGVLAIVVGGYNLYKYISSKIKNEDGCDVTSADTKRKLTKKIKEILSENNIWIALIGIIGVTLMVNLVELACSAGWPMIFSNLLLINEISTGGKIFYTLIYILMFLIDDLIVFTVAICSLKIKAFSNKMTKYSHLIGGILMILFGILMIFFPSFLTNPF